MTTLERIKRELNGPSIEKKIDKIINRSVNVLSDMILFAEYLERKHNKGFVVYWCTAGHPRFEVCNVHEYYDEPERDWNGPVQWHTHLAWKHLE